MRLSDWRNATRFLDQKLGAIDRNHDGTLVRAEGDAFLKSLRVNVDSVVHDHPMSKRMGQLLGYDTTGSVWVQDAHLRLSATLRWAESVIPSLDPMDLGTFSIDRAKEKPGGGDLPLFSLDALALKLAPKLKSTSEVKAPAPAPAEDPIRAATAAVGALTREIAGLELQNAVKAKLVNDLVSQIAARKAELESQFNQKRNIGLLGALFGVPALAVLSLVQMQRDDARLRQLSTDLTAAQADQSRIQGKLREYQGLKASVSQLLGQLEAVPPMSFAPVPQGTPKKLRAALESARALETQVAALQRLGEQTSLLRLLRTSAVQLGLDLDAVLQRLGTSAIQAQAAVDASRKATFKLLEALIAPNPQAAALKQLQGLAKEELGKLLSPFLDAALAGVPDALKDVLKKQLTSSLMAGLVGK